MADRPPHTVAVVQYSSVWLDRAATLERARDLVREASASGATLVTFPEAFVPGFPAWVWRTPPNRYDVAEALYGRLLAESIDLTSNDLRPLQDAARTHNVTIVCGVNERSGGFSGTTLYNTVVLIGPDGRLMNRHRKLVPTNAERLVWGMGDAAGLRVVNTPAGRIGALICWENYMPLARFTLYSEGVEIYVAPTWAKSDRWIASMRHIAFEGRCWVLGNGNILGADDIPVDIPGREFIAGGVERWINDGYSVIVNPEGDTVAGPLVGEEGILYADCDPAVVARKRYRLDVAGHYGRPDVFQLKVRREIGQPLEVVADCEPDLNGGHLTSGDEVQLSDTMLTVRPDQ